MSFPTVWRSSEGNSKIHSRTAIAARRADIEPCGELFRAVDHPASQMCHFWHTVARHFRVSAVCETSGLFRLTFPAQLRPIIQPFSNLALESAIGRIVEGLAAQRFREIVLAGERILGVVVVL